MYRKFSYLLIIASAWAFMACNETIDDVYDELDSTIVQPLKKEVTYTLQAADYAAISRAAVTDAGDDAVNLALAKAVATTNSLNMFATADKYVPAVLGTAFPALNLNSIAHVSYAYTEDYLAVLAGAPTHTLTVADYQIVWGADSSTGYLTPSTSPASQLPDILAANYPDAEAGDIMLVNYKYADQEPGPTPTRLTEEFSGYAPIISGTNTRWDQNGWTQVITQGTKFWRVRTRTVSDVATFYSEISAYGGATEVSEAYVISPLVDLTQTTDNEFSFDLCVAHWNYDGLKVLITQDAAALTDPANVTWDDVSANFTIPSEPASGYGPFATAGTMNLDAAYAGKKIYIAFKYNGETSETSETDGNTYTTTYQLDNILVKGTAPAGSVEVTPRVENAIYTYSGTAWSVYPDAMILNPADYAEMGLSTISAAAAPNYLPGYLRMKLPYAQEGTKRAVVYKTSATANAADEYIFSAGSWKPSLVGSLQKDQFVHNGTKWIFDPTVNHTMAAADYQFMCTYVLSHPTLGVYNRVGSSGTPYTNEEWYYGFSAYYSNVNFRLSGSTSSSRDVPCSVEHDTQLHSLDTPEEKIELLWKRLTEDGMIVYLQTKYPDTPVMSQGVQLYYNITLKVFYPDGVTNTSYIYTLKYKVLTAGSPGTPPTFEYEGKEQI